MPIFGPLHPSPDRFDLPSSCTIPQPSHAIRSDQCLAMTIKAKIALGFPVPTAYETDKISFIETPRGQIKLFDRNFLKAMGPVKEMVLFSNFPVEVQDMIYASVKDPRTIAFVEYQKQLPGKNNDRRFARPGIIRPPLAMASKQAGEALLFYGGYKCMLLTAQKKQCEIWFNPEIDTVHLPAHELTKINCHNEWPLHLMLHEEREMKYIQSVSIDIDAIMHVVPWVIELVAELVHLKKLIIAGTAYGGHEIHTLSITSQVCLVTEEDGATSILSEFEFQDGGRDLEDDAAYEAFMARLPPHKRGEVGHAHDNLVLMALQRVLLPKIVISITFYPSHELHQRRLAQLGQIF